jgi:hypothetical protein
MKIMMISLTLFANHIKLIMTNVRILDNTENQLHAIVLAGGFFYASRNTNYHGLNFWHGKKNLIVKMHERC